LPRLAIKTPSSRQLNACAHMRFCAPPALRRMATLCTTTHGATVPAASNISVACLSATLALTALMARAWRNASAWLQCNRCANRQLSIGGMHRPAQYHEQNAFSMQL